MDTIDHAWMGLWVPKNEARAGQAALDVRPHSSSGVITAGGLIYHAHALQPGLWRAPGTRQCLYFAEAHLWFRDADGVWQAPGGGAKICWFSDPDGNGLSLTQFG